MLGGLNRAAATYGGSIYLAYGLIALTSTSLINSATSLSLDPFLRLWAETILAILFGFLLLASGLLVGSDSDAKRIGGGLLGVLSSIIGAINVLVLLTTTLGLSQFGAFNSAFGTGEFVYVILILIVAAIATLLAGLPLGMVGSFQQLQEKETESRAGM